MRPYPLEYKVERVAVERLQLVAGRLNEPLQTLRQPSKSPYRFFAAKARPCPDSRRPHWTARSGSWSATSSVYCPLRLVVEGSINAFEAPQ